MRRELAIQPLLAPIAPLLPTILMSDCSHQILARDYLFQRWIPGTLWWDIAAELTVEEHDELWCQFGKLVHTIASVQAESFGLVQCGPRYPLWSLTLFDWLARTFADAEYMGVETTALRRLLEFARDHWRRSRRDHAPKAATRGSVVIQPAHPAHLGRAAHRRSAGC